MKRVGSSVAAAMVAVMVVGGAASPVAGEEGEAGWESTAAFYLWAAGLDGEVTMGPVTSTVDASFGDIFENLDGAFQGRFETTNGRFSVLSDLIFIDLDAEAECIGVRCVDARLEVKQTVFEVAGGYRLGSHFDLLFGARYTELDNRLDVSNPPGVAPRKDRHSWVEPLVGGRFIGGSGRWHYALRADIAGEDLNWQVEATLAFDLTKRLALGAGYRITDVEFDEGSGTDLFIYEMRTDGLEFGAGFRF